MGNEWSCSRSYPFNSRFVLSDATAGEYRYNNSSSYWCRPFLSLVHPLLRSKRPPSFPTPMAHYPYKHVYGRSISIRKRESTRQKLIIMLLLVDTSTWSVHPWSLLGSREKSICLRTSGNDFNMLFLKQVRKDSFPVTPGWSGAAEDLDPPTLHFLLSPVHHPYIS